jgi:hypothetical protein
MSYTSAAALVRAVGVFADRQPTWAECIVYDTRPDERFDLTLVSQRVYGTREDFLAVMAAAGLDSVEQELTPRRLVLPTLRQLAAMKEAAAFVTSQFDRTPAQVAGPLTAR